MSQKAQAEITGDIVVALITSTKGPSLNPKEIANAYKVIFDAVLNPDLDEEE